ncbi:insulinase family protein [Candidatus Wolfebacteria bacterium]|nr:insulinase family protein [Candidatus Wolfebacteria bacterium]
MKNFNKIILKNGLRIITVPKKDSLATTILVLVEAGAEYENEKINGISHFLEHLCFKGTKKRPKAIDIGSELAALGAKSNAFTGYERTGYYVKAQPKHFDKILDIIADLYLNPVFDSKELNKEKGVIIEEINMIEDVPMRKIGYLFLELLYGNQPAGRSIAGKKEIIKKLIRQDIINYRKKHYLSNSTTIIISGNFNEKNAIRKISNAFSEIPIGKKDKKIKTKEIQKKPEILFKKKESDQTHLILGTRAFNIFDKRIYALMVLSDILGGGMSSRLFQKIREEMGAAYYIRSDADFMIDHGYFAVSSGVNIKKTELVIETIIDEFKKIKNELIGRKELQKAKDHIIGKLFISLETSDELAEFYGEQEVITKKIITPQELAKKIQAVKAEEIQEIAKEIFKNEKLNLALIGPFKDKNRFEKILNLS